MLWQWKKWLAVCGVCTLLGAARLPAQTHENAGNSSFENLPDARRQNLKPTEPGGSVNPGTAGLDLPRVPAGSGRKMSLAILGDLSPINDTSGKYLQEAARELNLLHPDAVFTVGNLVNGQTRSGREYAKEVQSVRGVLDGLQMPWYPCAGANDVISGTRDTTDRRFEGLYQKYFGPLYYSVNAGDVHVIALDSEEGVGKSNQISAAQLQWLKDDLNKTFEARRQRYVLVLIHRPLWRDQEGSDAGNWDRVHRMLVEFNRRPIVSVEGVDSTGAAGWGGAGGGTGPMVAGVYAGSTQAYSQEPTRDGIRYTVLGPTAARSDQDAAETIRGYTLLRFDETSEEAVHAAVVEMFSHSGTAGPIAAEDVITAPERAVLDAIAGLPNETMGVEGILQPGGGTATLHAENPLKVPLDIELRLASAKNVSSETDQENTNPFAESLDAPWDFASPHSIRHLEPGAKEKWEVTFTNQKGEGKEVPPPQVEFVVHWNDPARRQHTVVLKRKVPVAPAAVIPLQTGNVGPKAAFTGEHFASGELYTWNLRGDEPREKAPEWDIAADDEHLYVRVRVTDSTPSYTSDMRLDPANGGLASDAVTISWPGEKDAVHRLWILPFAPAAQQLWENQETGAAETPLAPHKEKSGELTIEKQDKGYVVTLTLNRKQIGMETATARLNIGVTNNNGGSYSWTQSWAPFVPTAWASITMK